MQGSPPVITTWRAVQPPALNNGEQIFTVRRAPLVALFGLREDAEQRHLPIRKLIGVFGIAPGATHRASL